MFLLAISFQSSFIKSTGKGFYPGGDAEYYHTVGLSLLSSWVSKIPQTIPIKFPGYPYTVGAVYYIAHLFSDASLLVPIILNVFIGSLLPILIYKIAELIYNRNIAVKSVYLFIACTIFWFYSAIGVRDIIILFLILLETLLLIRCFLTNWACINKKILLMAAALIATTIILYFFRSLSLYCIICGLTLYVFFFQNKYTGITIFLLLTIIVIIFSAITNVNPVHWLINYENNWSQNIIATANKNSLGLQYIINSPFPLNIILRLMDGILTPLPSITLFPFVMTLPNFVLFLGASIWYFLAPFWAIGIWKSLKIKLANLLTLVTLVFLVGVSLIGGIDPRQKTQWLAFGIIQAAYGISKIKSKKIILAIIGSILFILSFSYFFLTAYYFQV